MGQNFETGRIKYVLVFNENLGLNRLVVRLKSSEKKNNLRYYQGVLYLIIEYYKIDII